jgi:hypothetical protein
MSVQETKDDLAALLANFLEVLQVERAKVQASGQKPTEIPNDLKTAVLQLISH